MTSIVSTSPTAQRDQQATEVTRPEITVNADQLSSLRQDVAEIVATDPQFRAALVADPEGTIRQLVAFNSEGAYALSKNLSIIIHQEGVDEMAIVIPSLDKVEGRQDPLALISLEAALSGDFRAELEENPRQTLEGLLENPDGSKVELPRDKAIKVILEGAGELVLVVPYSPTSADSGIALAELRGSKVLEEHLSCFTCDCFTARSCFTGTCFTASGCFSWSNDCK
jgi:hypothetical protein